MSEENNTQTQTGTIEVTEETLRDNRCVPVAEELLSSFPALLLPDEDEEGRTNIDEVKMTMLRLMLGADLNLTTEVPYIPQLVLNVLSGLNMVAQRAYNVPLDEARYNAIGRRILAAIAGKGLVKPERKTEDVEKDFAGVLDELNQIFEAEQLNIMEVKYVMDKVFDAFKALSSMVQSSIDQSLLRAEAKIFGVDFSTDITLKMLDNVLKANKTE